MGLANAVLNAAQKADGATDVVGSAPQYTPGGALLIPSDETVVHPTGEQVPELVPVDWWPDKYFACDGTYLYGHVVADARNFVRTSLADRSQTIVANPFSAGAAEGIRTIALTPVPGLMLAAVGEPSQTAAPMKIWRTTDYGATWTQVLQLGTSQGGAITGVWMLGDRNFCVGGSGAWYIGEYNINTARVSGGANDAVAIWKSIDQGATWAAAQVFNTGGLHVIRHIHALKNVNGNVLICSGDQNAECAFILWDEVSPLNIALSSQTLPVQWGSQRTRAVDVDVASDGYLYYMSDGSTGDTAAGPTDCGWARMPADLSAYPERLDGQIASWQNRSIYWSCKLSTGEHVYVESFEDTVSSDFTLGVWVTNPSKTRVERAGVFRFMNTVTGQVAPVMFQHGDTVYLSFFVAVLGKGSNTATVAFTKHPSRKWNGLFPDTLHPVYWVSPDSPNAADNADTGRGFHPALPWASLNYAMQGARMSMGGRCIMPAGSFQETLASAIPMNFDKTFVEASTYFTLEGAGKNATKHGMSAASTPGRTFDFGNGPQRIRLKDIHLTTYRQVNTQAIFAMGGTTSAQGIDLVRARVGGFSDIPTSLQNQILLHNVGAGGSMTIRAFDSELVASTTGGAYMVSGSATGPCHISLINSVCCGGRGLANPASSDVISLINSLICSYTTTAISMQATASVSPTAYKSRFASFLNLPQLINASAVSTVGAFKSCWSTQPLSPAGTFDAASRVDPGAAPRDPRLYDFGVSHRLPQPA